MPINTFIFLDLEGTGLGGPGEKPRITELSMVAIHRLALLDAASGYPHKPPRVMDKLTLCVYPMKPVTPGAAAISGLYNDNLLHKKDFDENLVQSLNLFIERQEAPVCLLAHNGLGYDYPLLKAELEALGLNLPEGVWCADTLPMLRELDAEDEAIELRKQEELLHPESHETPAGPLRRMERTPSLGFESSGLLEDRMRSVKRKLFDEEPASTQKKIAVEDGAKNDENDNVVDEETQKDEASEVKDEVINISDSEGGILCPGQSKELASQSLSSSSQMTLESQSSDASTVICAIPSNPLKKDTNGQSLESIPDSSGESTSEETTPAKSIPNLIQKLACTETISEDSGSDMELGRKVLRSTTWSSSLTDDMLVNYDLESAVKEYHENEEKNGAEKRKSSGKVSSTTDQMTPEKDLSCPEGNLTDSPIAAIQNLSVSSQNAPPTVVHEDRPVSKLEACRRNLQLQVENVRKTVSNTVINHPGSFNPSPKSIVHKPRVSYKLGDVYKRLFGSAPSKSHNAEDDCVTLLLICQKSGERAMKWCDDKAVLFGDVEPMYSAQRTPLKAGSFPHH